MLIIERYKLLFLLLYSSMITINEYKYIIKVISIQLNKYMDNQIPNIYQYSPEREIQIQCPCMNEFLYLISLPDLISQII